MLPAVIKYLTKTKRVGAWHPESKFPRMLSNFVSYRSFFLAAKSSSRSLVIGWSVGWLVWRGLWKVTFSDLKRPQKLKRWQNSKTQMVTKLKNQMVTKLKNTNCDITQKLKLWQNLITQIATKLKNSNCVKTKNSNCDKTQKLKWWQNLNYDKL